MINKNVLLKFLITCFFGWLGVHKFIEKKIGIGILYLLTCGFWGIGWIIDIIKSIIDILSSKKIIHKNTDNLQNDLLVGASPSKENKEADNLQIASPNDKSSNGQSQKNSLDMPNHDKNNNLNKIRSSQSKFAFVDDCNRYLKYEYYDVDVKGVKYRDFDISKIEINHQLYFNHESENQYDPNAIQVLYDDLFIGYIPKNNLQKMILNYSDGKEHQICGFISAVDENNKEIKIALGFYQEMTKKELDKIDYLDVKLIKTTKKDEFGNSRQDNLVLMSNGEEVELEFDYNSETYIVTNGLNEIGEISKANSKKLQKYEDDSKKFRSIVIDLDYNKSSNLEGKVRIFIN